MSENSAKEIIQYSLEWWDAISNILRNVVFAAAGLGAATIGVWLAWRRTKSLEGQTETDAKRLEDQSKSQAEFLITQTFTRAIDQLGSDKMEVRLGGVYALERVARSSQQDHWMIMETLTAFVREHAPAPEPEYVDGAPLPIKPGVGIQPSTG